MSAQLVLGAMPDDASPETHYPSGAWCFAGREDAHPGWDERYTLPPDPYAKPGEMRAAQDLANAVICQVIPALAGYCDRERGTDRGELFWETALAPWLFTAVHPLVERRQRLLDLISRHREDQVRVVTLPDACSFAFADSLDFKNNGVHSLPFNHWLFSRLLDLEGEAVPSGWQVEEAGPTVLHRPPTGPLPWKERARAVLHHLPFPKVKGFSLTQCLSLSLSLGDRREGRDRTIPLCGYDSAASVTREAAAKLAADWLPILVRCLPRAFLDLPLPARQDRQGRLRFMPSEFLYNNALNLRLAAWREGGGRLVDCQHGANDGNLECIGSTVLSYRQHAHLTWGWESHQPYPGNFVPLTHPLPLRVADAHAEERPELILVGTEMSTFTYRLKSRPMATDLVAYRRDKLRFFAALPDKLRRQSRYRPYFAVPAALEDASYVQKHVPGLDLCTGDLTQAMLGCRLLVLDHFGTSLSLALSANVPTLCWWDAARWRMGPETEEALDRLRQAGILYRNAGEAARAVARVWPDVAGWWTSPARQEARQAWVERYARNRLPEGQSLLEHWREVLGSL